MEDLVIDIFYWFDKSTKRKASLGEYCSFCNTEYRQIVKHVNTRWLSLERAVSRVLQQYEALKSYFLSEGISLTECTSTVTCEFCVITCSSLHADDSTPRFQRVRSVLESPVTEVYLLFYQSALQGFISFNKFLQREDPIIPVIYDQMLSFLKKLGSKFIKVSTLKDAFKDGDIQAFPYMDSKEQLSGMQVHVSRFIIILPV